MRRLVGSFVVIAAVFVTLPHCNTRASDGAACESSSECISDRCRNGYCAGSGCKVDADCNPGWKCISGSSAIFFSSGPSCDPYCGACPPNMYCEDGAGAGSMACREGKKPLAVRIEQAEGAIVGDPVTLRATVRETTGSLQRVAWSFDRSDGTNTTPELTVTRTFERTTYVELVVEDVSGRRGIASMNLEPKCRAEGRDCRPGLCCVGMTNTRCLSGATSTGFICRPPVVPRVTIAGPATAAKNQDVMFEAKVEGDAPVSHIEWRFGTHYRSGERLKTTMTYAFPYVGDISIVATAHDELGMTGEGKTTIHVE